MIDRARKNHDPHKLLQRPVRFSLGRQNFVKNGLALFDPHDSYFFAVALSWPRFILLFVAAEIGINTLFALLYALQPGCVANQLWPGFWSGFFFSMETLATVGYGQMYPATYYGHVISSLEIVTGVAFTALMTGLLFVRFSKPRAKILYARQAVVTVHQGRDTLMLRVGNGRASLLQDVEASFHVLCRVTTDEGRMQANLVELPLVRRRLPVMVVFWTIMHVVDEASPLYGLQADSPEKADLLIYVTIRARDSATGQEVTDLYSIEGNDIRLGMRYVDAISRGEGKGGGAVIADYALIHHIQADEFARPPQPADSNHDLVV